MAKIIKYKCLICGKEKTYQASQKKHYPGRGKFCSIECLSKSRKGRQVPWLKGKKRPEHSKAMTGSGNPRYGCRVSDETRKKISLRVRAAGVKKKKHYYCIQCDSEVTRHASKGLCKLCSTKIRFSNPARCPNWQGGKSFEEYGIEFDSSLKEQVRFRDKYKCQTCGCSQLENGKCLDVHHIDYDKKNNNLNNLIALCHRCHCKTSHNRNYWKTFFNERSVICSQ